MGKCSSGGGAGGSSGLDRATQKKIADIDSKIAQLKRDNVRLLQSDYTGSRNWGKQLEARSRKAAANNNKIKKLENEKKKLQKQSSKSQQSKNKTKTTWSEPKRDKSTGMYAIRVNGKTSYWDSYESAKAALKRR